MSNEFELGKDCIGNPVLFRKFKGRNADSMTGKEVIAQGEEEILALVGVLMKSEGNWIGKRLWEKTKEDSGNRLTAIIQKLVDTPQYPHQRGLNKT